MGSLANNLSIIQHNDLICVHNGGHTLGDQQHGAIASFLLKLFAQCGISLEIERREGVIENEDRRLLD